MKKKECPSCAMEVDAKATICPVCRYEFPVQNKIYLLVAIILLIVAVLYLIF
jgi:RNA polymerase subunit RPABC4/transcription elongation factor Spt4